VCPLTDVLGSLPSWLGLGIRHYARRGSIGTIGERILEAIRGGLRSSL
jgi:hypothetical protein